MMINIELREGQHARLADDLQRLYDYMVNWQLKHNVPIIRDVVRRDMHVSYNTLKVWLSLLEEHGYIMYSQGYLIVRGLQYGQQNSDT